MATSPYRYIVGAGDIYLAPVGESFPDVDSTPSGNWEKLGSQGVYDYSADGITITHSQTLNQFRGLGSTGPQKVSRSEEEFTVEGELRDMQLEEYAKIINDVSVSTGSTGGGSDTKEINLRQGLDVSEFAMLIRFDSPYGSGKAAQYQIPRVYQAAEPAPVLSKDGEAMLAFNFTALEDENQATADERFGQLIVES
jgi:hypothetical protein